MTGEMARLRCWRVPHSPYSPDLAIGDFYLFGRIKERLIGVTAIHADDFTNEVLSILGGHSTTGSKDASGAPNIRGTIIMSKTIWSI
jgi:hypothetical protein